MKNIVQAIINIDDQYPLISKLQQTKSSFTTQITNSNLLSVFLRINYILRSKLQFMNTDPSDFLDHVIYETKYSVPMNQRSAIMTCKLPVMCHVITWHNEKPWQAFHFLFQSWSMNSQVTDRHNHSRKDRRIVITRSIIRTEQKWSHVSK